jgi:hypothetical protein
MFKLYSTDGEFDRYLSTSKLIKKLDPSKPVKAKHIMENVKIDEEESQGRLSVEVDKLLAD